MQTHSKKENIIKGGVIDYYYIFNYIDTKKVFKRINILKKLNESELMIGYMVKNVKMEELTLEWKDHFWLNAKKDKNDRELLEYTQQRAFNRLDQTMQSEITFTNGFAYNYKNTYLLFPIKVKLNNGQIGYIDIYLDLLDSGISILNASL